MPQSHGTGQFTPDQFARLGRHVVFEPGALVFHPENIEIGDEVYVGHQAILKGYHRNRLVIGDGCWIGQQAFLHAAGGLVLGRHVGVGPGVKILTSQHDLGDVSRPIIQAPLQFAPVSIGDGADLGAGCVVLPGVRVGAGAQIGAGAVVSADIPDLAIAIGVPARVVRLRT